MVYANRAVCSSNEIQLDFFSKHIGSTDLGQSYDNVAGRYVAEGLALLRSRVVNVWNYISIGGLVAAWNCRVGIKARSNFAHHSERVLRIAKHTPLSDDIPLWFHDRIYYLLFKDSFANTHPERYEHDFNVALNRITGGGVEEVMFPRFGVQRSTDDYALHPGLPTAVLYSVPLDKVRIYLSHAKVTQDSALSLEDKWIDLSHKDIVL